MHIRIEDDDEYGDTDLSDEVTLDRIATRVVVGWINSPTHRIVLNWLADVESCVTSVITKQPRILDKSGEYGGEDYFYRINITYQTKENRNYYYYPINIQLFLLLHNWLILPQLLQHYTLIVLFFLIY